MKVHLSLLLLAFIMALILFCIVQNNTDRLITKTNELIEKCQKP